MTLTPRQVTDLLLAHGISPSRALGQNFVADPNTVRRIARLAGVGPGDRVLEIGAGLGSLTLALVETGASVTALEADRHLVPILEAVLPPSVRLVHSDAMAADWDGLLGPAPGWVLVANLPYNIATPLTLDLLDLVPAVERMLVMVQREVGERLAARPGSPAYSAVSVKVGYWAEASVAARVPSTVFVPRPKVESVLVDIRRRSAPAVDPSVAAPGELFELVQAGFATRRKMLRRALGRLVPPAAFEASGVAPTARAEDLAVEDWGRLAEARRAALGGDPT
ncbi:MAG: 16S rRNA (adenine(1518)-N(6)/adenine(1519)-N(6))-dimethyltransferase RsmA [Acidimicrobiales bacterium]|nr:16S rRNA (adenine(1518)-N(6)/adenine(1519)-N(6))-dimethyltransferase RsmA [Acidimicrobiales bacterium]